LQMAAYYGHEEVLVLLIPKATPEHLSTALDYAMKESHTECITLFKKYNARPTVPRKKTTAVTP